jgi:hypothetical protein
MQFILSFVLLLSAGLPVRARTQTGVPDVTVLRWQSPDGSRPVTFAEWQAGVQPRPWRVKTVIAPSRLNDRVDFFVEETLVSALKQSLDTLVADLARETTDIAVFSVSGTSAESLKALLASEYELGMTSAVLVGDLPIAWFQLIDDWDNDGVRDADEHYEEFPCDLFFMDLDGTWEDNVVRLDSLDSLVSGSDGIYDRHTDAITPEIAVSRLPASKIGDPAALLTAYFDRSHRYRSGALAVTDRALVYIDDDWIPNATQWHNDVGLLYPDRVFIVDAESTRIADYRPRIDTAAYQWISLMSHSWPGGHAMYYHARDSMDWFYATQIPSLDPQANFYNLFACSNVRFVESGYCGGRYVFQTSTGLGSIGSAKTGSMLEFADFYSPLGQGTSLGEAFRQWFEAQLANGCQNWERSWYYGMCLIADGALKPRVPQIGIAQERRDMTEMPGISDRVPSVHLLTNPSRSRVQFALTLAQPAPCRITLFDRTGRTVRTIAQGSLSPGTHNLSADVARLPAGVYFLAVSAGTGNTLIPVSVVH